MNKEIKELPKEQQKLKDYLDNVTIEQIIDKLKDDDGMTWWVDYQDQYQPNWKKIYVKEVQLLLDYITNLQQENKRLKQELNCKEYFSSTMPENTEFVILTKNNYDRQQKDIELELIDYKSRNQKAVEYIKKHRGMYFPSGCGDVINYVLLEYKQDYYENGSTFTKTENLLDILNGRGDTNVKD